MKEIGMLFKPEMVRALLEGRKTQTRRLKFRGEAGSKIWVKETWRTEERGKDMLDGILFAADDAFVVIGDSKSAANNWVDAHDNGKHADKWRPSIFMPKWACRTWLEILEVRQEPLRNISEDDAMAEGVRAESEESCVEEYCYLWDRINKEPGTRWEDNPTVFVIKFKAIR